VDCITSESSIGTQNPPILIRDNVYYVIGPGSKAEHERLRKTRPSSMDTYDLLSFEEEVNPDDGILVHVRRVSDKKKFLLPLANLEAAQKKSPNYQLLDDYAVWLVNWR
jgi:hypothetical protein